MEIISNKNYTCHNNNNQIIVSDFIRGSKDLKHNALIIENNNNNNNKSNKRRSVMFENKSNIIINNTDNKQKLHINLSNRLLNNNKISLTNRIEYNSKTSKNKKTSNKFSKTFIYNKINSSKKKPSLKSYNENIFINDMKKTNNLDTANNVLNTEKDIDFEAFKIEDKKSKIYQKLKAKKLKLKLDILLKVRNNLISQAKQNVKDFETDFNIRKKIFETNNQIREIYSIVNKNDTLNLDDDVKEHLESIKIKDDKMEKAIELNANNCYTTLKNKRKPSEDYYINFNDTKDNNLLNNIFEFDLNKNLKFIKQTNNYTNKDSKVNSNNIDYGTLDIEEKYHFLKNIKNKKEAMLFKKDIDYLKKKELNKSFEKRFKVGRIIHEANMLDQQIEIDNILYTNKQLKNKETNNFNKYLITQNDKDIDKTMFLRDFSKVKGTSYNSISNNYMYTNGNKMYKASTNIEDSNLFNKSYRVKGFTRQKDDKKLVNILLENKKNKSKSKLYNIRLEDNLHQKLDSNYSIRSKLSKFGFKNSNFINASSKNIKNFYMIDSTNILSNNNYNNNDENINNNQDKKSIKHEKNISNSLTSLASSGSDSSNSLIKNNNYKNIKSKNSNKNKLIKSYIDNTNVLESRYLYTNDTNENKLEKERSNCIKELIESSNSYVINSQNNLITDSNYNTKASKRLISAKKYELTDNYLLNSKKTEKLISSTGPRSLRKKLTSKSNIYNTLSNKFSKKHCTNIDSDNRLIHRSIDFANNPSIQNSRRNTIINVLNKDEYYKNRRPYTSSNTKDFDKEDVAICLNPKLAISNKAKINYTNKITNKSANKWLEIINGFKKLRKKYFVIQKDKIKIEQKLTSIKYDKEIKQKKRADKKYYKELEKLATQLYKEEKNKGFVSEYYKDNVLKNKNLSSAQDEYFNSIFTENNNINNKLNQNKYKIKYNEFFEFYKTLDSNSRKIINNMKSNQRYYDRIMSTDANNYVSNYDKNANLIKFNKEMKLIAFKTMALKSQRNELFDFDLIQDLKEAEKLNHWSFTEFFIWQINRFNILKRVGFDNRLKIKK